MRALINHADYSVCSLEQENETFHPSLLADPNVFLVEFDPLCLSEVDPEDYPNLFWDEQSNTLYQHPEIASLSTPSGLAKLRQALDGVALIPPESRTEEQNFVVGLAHTFLPSEEVEQKLMDNDIESAEIQRILGALDDASTP